jgi:cell division transport system permease protein
VREASPVPEAEMRRTLERWLGSAASSRDLPVPALVTLELAPSASPAAIEARVRQAVASARLIAQTGELQPLLNSVWALQWLALSLVILMAAATAAAVVLAARGALETLSSHGSFSQRSPWIQRRAHWREPWPQPSCCS